MCLRSLRPILLALFVLHLACTADEPETPRDLVLITVDTLRVDAVGGYDTPHWNRLAASGTSFTTALTPLPRTTPALASLFTGLWPREHGSREVGEPMTAGMTVAEVLRGRGFLTVAVSTNAAAGPRQGLDAGFEHFVSYEELVERFGEQLNPYEINSSRESLAPAAATTRQALEAVRAVPGAKPIFLWVHYLDPHFLYNPPGAWDQDPSDDSCLAMVARYVDNREQAGEIFADVGGVSSRVLPECRRLYEEEVAYTDAQVGRLLEGLQELGRLDRALVVLTSDHGENLGEEGLFYEHGNNVHDASLRVPLLFAGPGIAAGSTVRMPVTLLDLAPTILSYLGVPPEEWPRGSGRDLSRVLRSGRVPGSGASRPVFAESGSALWNESVDRLVTGREGGRVCVNGTRFSLCRPPGGAPLQLFDHTADPSLERDVATEHPAVVLELRPGLDRWSPSTARLRTAHAGRFKLVQRPTQEGGWTSRLVDLTEDPAEAHDVSARHPRTAEALRRLLEEWADTHAPREEGPLDPEIERSLRSLGYLH